MAEKRVRVPIVRIGDAWSDDDIQLHERTKMVQVGEPWTPDDLELVSEHELKLFRARTAIAFAVLFGILVLCVAIYAILSRDRPLIERVWEFATGGTFVVLAWACGPHILKIISRIRFNDRDES